MKQPLEKISTSNILYMVKYVLNTKMSNEEFITNEKILEKLAGSMDILSKNPTGYVLFSLTRDKQRSLILINKNNESYSCYKWNIEEQIEKTTDIQIHDTRVSSDIQKILDDCSYYDLEYVISSMIVKTFDGYGINIENGKQFISYTKDVYSRKNIDRTKTINQFTGRDFIPVGESLEKYITECITEVKAPVDSFIEQHKDIPFVKKEEPFTIKNDRFFIGILKDIREVNGVRNYKVDWVDYKNSTINLDHGKAYGKVQAGCESDSMNGHNNNGIIVFENTNRYNNSPDYNSDNLTRIPYNYVDNGRIIVAFKIDMYNWTTFLSPDPKADPNYKENFVNEIKKRLKEEIESQHNIFGSTIPLQKPQANMFYQGYVSSIERDNPGLKGIRLKLKTLKTMFDEYDYLIKKNKAMGKDIHITDNIIYNHKEGKIKYNDFSIGIDDEHVKAQLYQSFNTDLLSYFRGAITEEEIINNISATFFNALKERLSIGRREDLNLDIKINDKIIINIKGKLSIRRKNTEVEQSAPGNTTYSQLFYINDYRFNKNEVITTLKEITCYRSQEEADSFIKNIGRLGLSVYIGITTGYQIRVNGQEQILKFKKLKGRSNYKLMLDNSEIEINGKKLIGYLYEQFLNNTGVREKELSLNIYKSCNSLIDYLRYSVLIDATYENYKKKAKSFLDKKVADMGGAYTKYLNNANNRIMDAIYVKGISGKNYIIAYDSKDSYIFMDPIVRDTQSYQNGKYICMIDQSNIKSNISYDTIVAKLMALKNDSSIAHTIYNLQEEL